MKYTTQLLYGSPVFATNKSTQRISDLADFLLASPRWHNVTFEGFASASMAVWNVEKEKVI